MPKRKVKQYKRPRKPFDKVRFEGESILVKKYGLKNKREIWKTDSIVNKIRGRAKLLLTKTEKEQEKFIEKLRKQGFKVKDIADVLALKKEDYLKRRLQSIVVEKKLATQTRQARQFIVHKHILINGKVVNVPSYLVPVDEEDKITLNLVKKEKVKKGLTEGIEEKGEEIIEEKSEGEGNEEEN